jgi:uncharacterized protein
MTDALARPLFEVSLTPEEDAEGLLESKLAPHLTTDEITSGRWVIKTRTIDARHKKVRVRYQIQRLAEPDTLSGSLAEHLKFGVSQHCDRPIVIIGAGPAGLFCAWRLLKQGHAVMVIDRGGDVRGRRPALAQLNRDGLLDEENNYCFGEGGAGTFSDGKLYTRSTKKGSIRDVLEVFVAAGAPVQVLTDARPHIGTNRLPKVVETFRNAMVDAGANFRFHTKVVDLERHPDGVRITLSCGETFTAPLAVLATGHSANDTYDILLNREVTLVPKAFAMGVRIEHPQPLIDKIQYGGYAGHAALGAAPYQLRRTVEGVGTFSFCMCPGGFMVASTTAANHVVVNGMSPSKRNSPYANSGVVVSIAGEQFHGAPRAALEYQRQLERRAFEVGGGQYRAPAQRVTDFLNDKNSSTLPECSYRPGLTAARLDDVLPKVIAKHLRSSIRYFDRERLRGYATEAGVMVGVESRSSSAVRIPRDPATLMCPDFKYLIPCGEGAGYAGGIMSAAIDGIRCADAAIENLSKAPLS